jgi:hypothetical protein
MEGSGEMLGRGIRERRVGSHLFHQKEVFDHRRDVVIVHSDQLSDRALNRLKGPKVSLIGVLTNRREGVLLILTFGRRGRGRGRGGEGPEVKLIVQVVMDVRDSLLDSEEFASKWTKRILPAILDLAMDPRLACAHVIIIRGEDHREGIPHQMNYIGPLRVQADLP